ncbi:MAG: DUF948 domain-containing protein [Candidatus Moranbacteria bacterium]|nr:DUF948 domain-containing protein [Candidatus Moranbacteria bacterium]MBP6033876.1 DUF948 domain-containing protein [Candidatus Moranbacteria bacterium]MBP7695666.1 DUF948 domain-containing protein [Candidatus Moranbacteria bacterium]
METPLPLPEVTEPKASRVESLALAAPQYLGSPTSLILHTCFFVGIFTLQLFGFSFDQIMLILTTLVSLEAIYLSLFIQMTVNQHAKQIEEVSEDVEDISEDVEEISKDIDTIQEDVEEISEDVEEISKDIDTIQEDVKEISEDVEDISEDVDELGVEIERDDQEDAVERTEDQKRIEKIESAIEILLQEIRAIKHEK